MMQPQVLGHWGDIGLLVAGLPRSIILWRAEERLEQRSQLGSCCSEANAVCGAEVPRKGSCSYSDGW